MTEVTESPHAGKPTRVHLRNAYTLVELLVTITIIGLLLSVILPGLAGARSQARTTACGSNVRQIALANLLYVQDNRGRACPGAANPVTENLHRWHGTRETVSSRFDPARGPLAAYLGPDSEIRDCPSFHGMVTDPLRAFELGNGGYGYNNAYIGRALRYIGAGFYQVESNLTGVLFDRIRRPTETLMFADTAFVNGGLIEYSFAEPRFAPTVGTRAVPSVHFRHNSRTNVAWCDGHVDRRRRTFTRSSPWYVGDPARFDIGWFGTADNNEYFDLH